MFAQRLFNLVSRLIFSRWARGYEEHHGACEDSCAARLGLLYLEINRCFVLDHDDAFISLRIPTLWGKLHLGHVACLGEDEIRRPGFYTYLQKPFPKFRSGQSTFSSEEEFPF